MLCIQRSNKIAGNYLRALSMINSCNKRSGSFHWFALSKHCEGNSTVIHSDISTIDGKNSEFMQRTFDAMPPY